MSTIESRIILECDQVTGPASRGLACLLPTSDQRRDQTTKDLILSRLASKSATAAQLAVELRLTPPGLYRHISELRQAGLLTEAPPPMGSRRQERYYQAAFPVVTSRDQERMMPEVMALAQDLTETFRRHEGALQRAFRETELSAEGWSFHDLALCVLDEAEKMSRSELVEGGQLPDVEGRILWGREERTEAGLEEG